MKTIVINSVFILFALTGVCQNNTFDYFGLPSPGDKIEPFAPGIVSLPDSNEFSLAISPLGDEVFFARGAWPEYKIMQIKKIENQWTKPQVASFSADCHAVEPAFSPDGRYLFFSSNKGIKNSKQYRIWRVEKVGDDWENAKKIIDIANPDIWEFHPAITDNGTVYFCYWDSKKEKGSIYKSENLNGNYLAPVKVDIPFEKQSSVTNPFIDPAKKYIITSSATTKSKYGYDAFISYRNGNGWSEPVNFGNRFNTLENDESFDVSPDGKFLFIYKGNDVYWTETKGIIK